MSRNVCLHCGMLVNAITLLAATATARVSALPQVCRLPDAGMQGCAAATPKPEGLPERPPRLHQSWRGCCWQVAALPCSLQSLPGVLLATAWQPKGSRLRCQGNCLCAGELWRPARPAPKPPPRLPCMLHQGGRPTLALLAIGPMPGRHPATCAEHAAGRLTPGSAPDPATKLRLGFVAFRLRDRRCTGRGACSPNR